MNEELKVIIKAEISQFKKGIDDAKKEMSSFKDEVKKHSKDADTTLKKMGNGIKEVGKKIGKAMVAGAAAGAAAVLALGKSALDCYGNYEQLTGGVEKLFGDSANTVMGYAKDAYKNQQMSANQYMEIATSFSAGLIASLGGDTAAAASYANLAMTDMSDNANTFGTSMESVQNAYQGFAKQNYTMLDNLKLGYGGTKEEMERLIADANRVKEANGEMANLSIDSFADVVEAIHTVQTEMGITGTTSNEAATTIEGSIAMAKAAWDNWKTGLMDDNADIGQLTDDLINSVKTVIENVAPRIGEFFDNLVDSIHNALAEYPAAQAVFDTVVASLGTIKDKASEVINFVTENWSTIQPILIAAAAAVGVITTAVIAYNAVAAIKAAMDAAQVTSLGALIAAQLASAAATMVAIAPYVLVVAAIAAVIAVIVLCVKHWDKIKEACSKAWSSITSAVSEAVGKVVDWFNNMKEAISEKAEAIKATCKEKFNAAKDAIVTAMGVAKEGAVSTLNNMKSAYNEAGGGIKGIVAALSTGVRGIFSTMFNTIDSLTGGKLGAIRDKFGTILGAARDKVKSILDRMKSFFNFSWSLPHLKMPHVSITGKFNLMPPSVPKFSISWYAKGGVFDKPTLFNGNGMLSGLGENGAEAVVPLENNTEWLNKIADKLSAKMGDNQPTIIRLYVDGKTFAETSITSINQLTKQTGNLALNLV